jgi:hypothetical protein
MKKNTMRRFYTTGISNPIYFLKDTFSNPRRNEKENAQTFRSIEGMKRAVGTIL